MNTITKFIESERKLLEAATDKNIFTTYAALRTSHAQALDALEEAVASIKHLKICVDEDGELADEAIARIEKILETK